MARIRSIKIDLFMDDALAEVSLAAHLLLAGLPVLADSAGRLEDRPRRIQALLFPYRREIDVDACLDELHDAGAIVRYVVADVRYVEVANWDRDQRPHVKEAPSVIPPPADSTEPRLGSELAGNSPGTRRDKSAGILDSGLGVLDLGSGDSPGIAPAQPAPGKPARRAKEAKPPDPRHAALVKALTDAGWPFDGGRDAAHVKALLGLADQQEATRGECAGLEVLRRARIAWEQFPGFHSARTLSGLRSKWGEFAAPDGRREPQVANVPRANDPGWVVT